MANNSNINECLERFFNGETSCKEEKELFAYFRQKNISSEVEQYREMMLWYDAGLQVSQKNAIKENNVKSRWIVSRYISIAASVIIVLSIGFSYITQNLHNKELYEIYEGSYIIENGVKNTDLSKILSEVQRGEKLVEQAFDETLQQAIDGVEDPIEREYIINMMSN